MMKKIHMAIILSLLLGLLFIPGYDSKTEDGIHDKQPETHKGEMNGKTEEINDKIEETNDEIEETNQIIEEANGETEKADSNAEPEATNATTESTLDAPADDSSDVPNLSIDIPYLGARGVIREQGVYFDDGKGGWHDLEYIRNLYKFTDYEYVQYRLASLSDLGLSDIIASGLFESDKFYFTKSIPGTFAYNVYCYDLQTLELKLLREGLTNFYLMPLVVYPGDFSEEYLMGSRGTYYYGGSMYYIHFPSDALSSAIYRMDKGKAPVLLASQPEFSLQRQADLIVKVDKHGVYYLDFNWVLHRLSLDGSKEYRVTPYQVAAERLLIEDGHIFAYLQNVEGGGQDGMYYADGHGNFTCLVKGDKPKDGSSMSLKPIFVVDNWLYYEHMRGSISDNNSVMELHKVHLQTAEQQQVLAEYKPYTYLGMYQDYAYFYTKNDQLYRLDLETNEFAPVGLITVASPLQSREAEEQNIERHRDSW